ncbi:MAG: HD domain-containing phosphohydrolase [candidate division WOR-3 bacterium]
MVTIILVFSIAIQTMAAIIALFYIKKAPGVSWFFLSIALFLMVLRRVLSLPGFFLGKEIIEIIGLVISGFMFLGVIYAPQIFKELERTIQHIKGLLEIDRIILTGLTPKGIIGAVKKAIVELFDCDSLAIYTVDQSGVNFNRYADYNLNEEFHNQITSNDKELLAQIIRNKKTAVLRDNHYGKNPGFPFILKNYNFATGVGIPLILRGAPIGILFLFSNKRRDYKKGDIKYMEGIARQVVIAIERIQTIENTKEMNLESVLALVQAIEMRDPCTRGHSVQVADLAVEIARVLDFSEHKLELLKFAGLLHDVGKIAIPESILQKPERLSNAEWLIIKRHPVQSVEIIKPIKNLREIEKWILYHHERWDGTGYPGGLKEKEIPLEARILAVCDTYSAIISDRPYRKGLSDEHAREEIKKFAGRQFDPEVVRIFLNIQEEFLRNLAKNSGGSS